MYSRVLGVAMAGIDKVCEYSGEYPGWAMYGYKRNLIQVMPKYRKLFKTKGERYLLFFWDEGNYLLRFGGAQRIIDKAHLRAENASHGWFGKVRGLAAKRIGYALIVPSLPGRVVGCYTNSTYDFKATQHKLSKLLGIKGKRQLVMRSLSSHREFYENHDPRRNI